MEKPVRCLAILACVLCTTLGSLTYGQSTYPSDRPNDQPPPLPPRSRVTSGEESGRVGIGVKGSLLGGGAEVAVRVTHFTNIRAGFNVLSYSRDFSKDGITYNGTLGFKTVEAHYDIFPFAGNFHVSPGLLIYAGDPITASVKVPSGQTFTLGGATYYSDTTSPLSGTGKINWNRAAPMATIGWGNLVPRGDKHFSIPFEIGVAFQGSPKATLNLAGSVCEAPGNVNCVSAATDPGVQANVQSEQSKLNNSMSLFKAYPIISIGVGYKF